MHAMTAVDVSVAVAATGWLDVERRWPLWSAARHRHAAVAVLDQAIRALPHGAGLLTGILEVDPVSRGWCVR